MAQDHKLTSLLATAVDSWKSFLTRVGITAEREATAMEKVASAADGYVRIPAVSRRHLQLPTLPYLITDNGPSLKPAQVTI